MLVAILDDHNSKQDLSKKRKSRNPNFENSAIKLTEMKKIFLLSILLFQLTFVFGQNTQWSNWTSMSCYQGFKTSANNLGFVKSINEYSWKMKIKNNYNRRVHFNMSWIVGNEKQSIGRFSLNPGEETNHVSYYFKSNSTSWQVEVTEVCFGENWMSCTNGCYAECDNGSPKQPNCDKNTGSTNSTNQTNTSNQQNDPTFDRNNASFQDYYKRATAAGQAGNYDEAISLWNSAIAVAVNDDQRNNARAWLAEAEKAKNSSNNQKQNQEIANRNAEAQRQQQLLKQQQKAEAINQLTTTTVDLVTYFANRKNALRNSLSNEDGQALLDIVNSENPTNYTQNIIQIFRDLGYTLRETERKDGYVIITLNNDVANINDFMMIFVRPASYDYYNSISFSYHRKQKLREQLAVLGDKLKGSDGLELKGISATNRQKKIVEDEKKLNDKTKRAKLLIDNFEKNNYWNSTDRLVFSYAKDIAEAYEDENSLNDKTEAIRYYKKAATISLEDLASPWPSDKNMRSFQEKELAKVYFKIGYLLDETDGKSAIEWYHKSATVFKTNPFKNIARIYMNGQGGVEKDWKFAVENYEKAANEDDAEAMFRLGKLYNTGGPNLEKDEAKAKKWFKKACKEDKKYCN